MSGRTARRDCFTDASATRRQRSSRGGRAVSARHRRLRPRRDERLHGGDAEHHRVADDVVHLVALEHGLRQREGDGRLRGGVDARHHLHARRRAAAATITRAENSWPRPSKTATTSPTPSRSTRVRCSASSRGSVTVSSPGSSSRRKKSMHDANYTGAGHRPEPGYTLRAMFFRGQIIGKYKILSTIGSGGFGTVYLAEDTWIDKKVALKVPHKQGVDFGELLREPRLLATPQSPEHRHDPDRGEAGERLLHRDGVRAGRDARGDHRARRRARRGARARLHLPDLQRRRSRAPAGRAAPRPAAVERAGHRQRPAEGRRLRHVALPRNRGARHDGHRQPALHGARAVPRQGRVRLATSTRSASRCIRC